MADSLPSEYLYHGTTVSQIDDIVSNGIQPEDGMSENDTGIGQPTVDGNVYLTTQYGPYFGLKDSDSNSFGLVEIHSEDLDTENLYPDERYIEEALRMNMISLSDLEIDELVTLRGDSTQRTRIICENIGLFQSVWRASITGLGTCSHDGSVPPAAIKRIIEVHVPQELAIEITDTSLTIESALVNEDKYGNLVQWLTGRGPREEAVETLNPVSEGVSKDNLPDFALESIRSKWDRILSNVTTTVHTVD